MQPTSELQAKTCVANLCAEFADVIFLEEFGSIGADRGKMNVCVRVLFVLVVLCFRLVEQESGISASACKLYFDLFHNAIVEGK